MRKLSLFLALILPVLLMAHPGHGDHTHDDDGYSIIHYFTQPEHALLTIGLFAFAGGIYVYRLRKRQSR
jgi:hypothetical protein